jgi:hypothetical protein
VRNVYRFSGLRTESGEENLFSTYLHDGSERERLSLSYTPVLVYSTKKERKGPDSKTTFKERFRKQTRTHAVIIIITGPSSPSEEASSPSSSLPTSIEGLLLEEAIKGRRESE